MTTLVPAAIIFKINPIQQALKKDKNLLKFKTFCAVKGKTGNIR